MTIWFTKSLTVLYGRVRRTLETQAREAQCGTQSLIGDAQPLLKIYFYFCMSASDAKRGC